MKSLKNFIKENLKIDESSSLEEFKKSLKEFFDEDIQNSDYGDFSDWEESEGDEFNKDEYYRQTINNIADACVDAVDKIDENTVLYSTNPYYFGGDNIVEHIIDMEKENVSEIQKILAKAAENLSEYIPDANGYWDDGRYFVWCNAPESYGYGGGEEFNLIIKY